MNAGPSQVADIETLLPSELRRVMVIYLLAHKTGSITIRTKDGKIMAWELTEHGRADTGMIALKESA